MDDENNKTREPKTTLANKELLTKTKNEDDKNIYNHINNLKQETIENQERTKTNTKKMININKYFVSTILSVLLYSVCAWLAQIPITEIIDLELPIIIAITLIITGLSIQGYSKIIYPVILIVSAILFVYVNTSYALFVAVSLISLLITNCVEGINTNKYDYQINSEAIE